MALIVRLSSLLNGDEQGWYMAAIAFTILPIIPLAAWFLLVGWSSNKPEGEVLLRVPVPLLARVKMLAMPFVLGLAVLVTGVVMREVPWWLMILSLAIYAAVLSIPISYTLTTIGICTGKGGFRRWTEFAGVRRSPSGAILQGGPRATSYPIFLSGNREDDDFVLTLKNLVRDSYQGKATERDRLRGAGSSTQSGGETSTTSSMSH